MAKLQDVMAYICLNYPTKEELSNARLTKMVYLADWKSAIDLGRQMTRIVWFFDNYGPFVWDIMNTAKEHKAIFGIVDTNNLFGEPKTIIRVANDEYEPRLSESEQVIIDHVIKKTRERTWNEFIQLVYSTYPIANSERYTRLNLDILAKEYKKNRRRSDAARDI